VNLSEGSFTLRIPDGIRELFLRNRYSLSETANFGSTPL